MNTPHCTVDAEITYCAALIAFINNMPIAVICVFVTLKTFALLALSSFVKKWIASDTIMLTAADWPIM